MKNLLITLGVLLALSLYGKDPAIAHLPTLIDCGACKNKISKASEMCVKCGHPTALSIDAYVKLARAWAEWEANPKSYGGAEVLAKIKKAWESGATKLSRRANEISDLSPLAGLTNLEKLYLSDNEISDLSPLKGLTNLEELNLYNNKISDLSPLKGLTKLESLSLGSNKITDISPLAGLTNLKYLSVDGHLIPEDQKAMLKKALWRCNIYF